MKLNIKLALLHISCSIRGMSEKKKESILSYSLDEFKAQVAALGLKPFIAAQVFQWVYKNFVISFDDMKNVSKVAKEILKQHFVILPFIIKETLPSKEENAIKCILQLEDGKTIECVILKEKTYTTLCVSSQCGCPVDCKFCLTGVVGFKRNLVPSEIVGQLLVAGHLNHPVRNLVFMGMGEPLLNFDNVFRAISIIGLEEGFNIGHRHITISTAGYLKGIERLIKEEKYVNLAFSVGATNPIKREKFMPITTRNPFDQVVRTLHHYLSLHNRKLTLEYTLLEGVNDAEIDIKGLVNLSRYLNAKINLINLNPHPQIPFKPLPIAKLKEIQVSIKRLNLPVTIRYKKGQDIVAACGQLGESLMNKPKDNN